MNSRSTYLRFVVFLYRKTTMNERITTLFGIKYPIIQAGMVWCSGWKLASAVSNAGGLGIIGAGSMNPSLLDEHLSKCNLATNKPYAVNLPLLYSKVEDQIETIVKHNVPIVFTSAGNPTQYTAYFKEHGIKVVHVISSLKFALKAQQAGVDAVVAEGFEAGGHNGREETTTLCLLELLRGKLDVPLIAAGGIASGRAMLAAMILGAEGVQIGTRFAAATESSAHEAFKKHMINANEGATSLTLKEITPVRMMKNDFFNEVQQAYAAGAGKEQLTALLGHGRSKKGILEGDLVNGELEIGQIVANISKIESSADIINDIVQEFKAALASLPSLK